MAALENESRSVLARLSRTIRIVYAVLSASLTVAVSVLLTDGFDTWTAVIAALGVGAFLRTFWIGVSVTHGQLVSRSLVWTTKIALGEIASCTTAPYSGALNRGLRSRTYFTIEIRTTNGSSEILTPVRARRELAVAGVAVISRAAAVADRT